MSNHPRKRPPSKRTKADLVDVVYESHGALTRREAAGVIEAIFETVKTTLGEGRPVRIRNFGVFAVEERAGRRGVAPGSGEPLFIPEHRGLSFRASRQVAERVNDGDEG